MLKIEQVLRNEFGENVLGDFFENITIKGEFAIVKKEGLWGLYNIRTLKKVLECEWDKILLNGNFILMYKSSLLGVYDNKGNKILNCEWDKVVLYEKGILTTKNKLQAFYNYNGEVILDCFWKRIEPYAEVLIAYRGNGVRRQVYDYRGNHIKE